MAGNEAVWAGSLFTGSLLASGDSVARAVTSGKRIFISRIKPSSVSTLAAISDQPIRKMARH
jgi:hypothetical protein